MLFKAIDKFFDKIKYLLSLIIFVLIAMATLFFIYWLLFSAKIAMPEWFNRFAWSNIDFGAQVIKGTPLYKELIPVLPVLVSGVYIILTYFANCLMTFLENNHKRFGQCVEQYKSNLARTINEELHNDFINELKRTTFMMFKIKVAVTKQESYLNALTLDNVDPIQLEDTIQKQILTAVSSDLIQEKGMDNNSVYFVITDFEKARDFMLQLVNTSADKIKAQMRPKITIGFYCGVELYNDIEEKDNIKAYLDKIVDLKITNKIAATPRFKLYYENIYPTYFWFDLMGEYNLSKSEDSPKNIMIYSIKRK